MAVLKFTKCKHAESTFNAAYRLSVLIKWLGAVCCMELQHLFAPAHILKQFIGSKMKKTHETVKFSFKMSMTVCQGSVWCPAVMGFVSRPVWPAYENTSRHIGDKGQEKKEPFPGKTHHLYDAT